MKVVSSCDQYHELLTVNILHTLHLHALRIRIFFVEFEFFEITYQRVKI